jgi:hypothetical protein
VNSLEWRESERERERERERIKLFLRLIRADGLKTSVYCWYSSTYR